MKIFENLLTMAVVLGCCLQTAAAAVTFTNTPASVSNTYSGSITLSIGGLTNTETVVVQKFLDANTNGVIDGTDPLVQQFTLQDGTGFVIGGITDSNVPGDLNPTAGAITATLNFKNGDFIQNLIGKYLYKLSSPGGHFTPITNSFSVTNSPFAQKFTGNVVSNSTSTTLPNAVVLLFPPPRPGHNGPGNPQAGTVANNAGAYTIMAPAGTYTLLAFESNYVSFFKKAPVLTLGSGQTISTNLTVTNATASISGTMVDAANNAIVLPGVFMPVQCTNGLLALSFSDTNGNFTARVTANQWSLGSDDSGLIVHGYVGLNNGATASSGATGVTLAFPKANALFYGSVKDILGNPIAGIDVNTSDYPGNLYQMDGFTDPNGNYFIGVVNLGGSDSWQLGLSSETMPTNYDFSQPQFGQNGGTNLTVGQALLQNFTGILATNQIIGNVKDSNGTNISGVGVFASLTLNGTNYQAFVDTDTNGNYSLNVANGTWGLGVNCTGGSDSLSQLGSYVCPNNQFPVISGNNATNNFIVQLCIGISISTLSPLPVGEVNVFYNQSIQASDCSGNYNWSQIGGTLPGNLSLFTAGSSYTLSGSPSGSGTFSFTVQVNDGAGNTTNRQFSVTISNAVQVTTGSLPNGTNGLNYSQQLQAAGGVPFGGASPYNWSLSGSLPSNLNLSPSGLLSGSLTTSGTFNFTVQATDSLGGTASQPLSLTVVVTNFPPLTVGTGGGQIIVLWPASAGTNFTLQTTTNLSTGPWVPATNGVPAISFVFSNTAAAQFFRLH
ncbi:MAG TPA: putative Ig domain-containing protein [Candidatus Acidoferrum sp.]|jgi:hypothetical protein|nr:putative Ig domain-containing protein [Candidatus Acidoferrum sp.]